MASMSCCCLTGYDSRLHISLKICNIKLQQSSCETKWNTIFTMFLRCICLYSHSHECICLKSILIGVSAFESLASSNINVLRPGSIIESSTKPKTASLKYNAAMWRHVLFCLSVHDTRFSHCGCESFC